MPHIYLRKGRLGSITQFIRELSRHSEASDRIYTFRKRRPSHNVSFLRLHQDRLLDSYAPFVRGEVLITEREYSLEEVPVKAAECLWNTSCRYIEHSERISPKDPHPIYPSAPEVVVAFDIMKSTVYSESNQWVSTLADCTAWLENGLRAEGLHADVHSCFAQNMTGVQQQSNTISISMGMARLGDEGPYDSAEFCDMIDFVWAIRCEHIFPMVTDISVRVSGEFNS